MNLATALEMEDRNLVDAINSDQESFGNSTFIGPTAVSFDMLPFDKRLLDAERELFREWKQQDLEDYYHEQHK